MKSSDLAGMRLMQSRQWSVGIRPSTTFSRAAAGPVVLWSCGPVDLWSRCARPSSLPPPVILSHPIQRQGTAVSRFITGWRNWSGGCEIKMTRAGRLLEFTKVKQPYWRPNKHAVISSVVKIWLTQMKNISPEIVNSIEQFLWRSIGEKRQSSEMENRGVLSEERNLQLDELFNQSINKWEIEMFWNCITITHTITNKHKETQVSGHKGKQTYEYTCS